MFRAFEIDVLVEDESWDAALDGDAESFCARILAAAAATEKARGAASVLLTTDTAMAALNRNWRGQDKPTNVLSFPAGDRSSGLLGDIALGSGIVAAEADAQGKPFKAHAAHLLVHGFLHLLGHDHEVDAEAERMEARERAILADLGYPDPYRVAGDT